MILWILYTNVCLSQNVEFRHINKYTTSEGLSSYNVRKIIKDKNGFVWVATQYGLSRFDGKQFTNYSKSELPGFQLCGVDIRDLVEDPENSMLWVFPGDLSFNSIDLNKLRVTNKYPVPARSAEEFGMAISLFRNSLWMGTSNGLRVFRRIKDVFTEDTQFQEDTNLNRDLQCLFKDEHGNLWCFYNGYGICIYNSETRKKIKQCPLRAFDDLHQVAKIDFRGCIATANNQLLIATSQGLKMIIYDSLYNVSVISSPCSSFPGLNTESIEAIGQTNKGQVLVASHSALFKLNRNLEDYTMIREAGVGTDGDWLSSVQCIYCDNKDNIWLGCEQGLALLQDHISPFQPYYYDKISNRKLEHVRSVFVTGEHEVLVGLRNGIATVNLNTERFSIIDEEHLYHHIYKDKNGRIQVARPDGLFLFQDSQLIPIKKYYPEFKQFASCPVNSNLYLHDSLMILGTENDMGILVWNLNQHTVTQVNHSTVPALASNVVNNIFHDGKDRLWVLSDNVISILSGDFEKTTPLQFFDSGSGSAIKLFFDMCEDHHFYWIASYGTGLIQLDSNLKIKKIFDTRSGLSDNGVYQVFPIGNKLVITTDKGLSVLDIDHETFKNYYREDGLHSNSFEEVAGGRFGDLIYAGGVKGFTIIDPSRFITDTLPPKVYINRILISCDNQSKDIDTTDIRIQDVGVPNNALQTSIFFSGINYSNPERTTFAFRILEKHEDWVNIGKQNYINLIGLPPGTYHLEIKAANDDNRWSQPTTITLVYRPKWYQTWSFKLLMVLAFVGIVFGFYRMRINQIIRQQMIRKEVASDLHDDIGSSLHSVKVFAHLAQADPNNTVYIEDVQKNLNQANAGLRDMIWVLDDREDTLEDICKRLQQFAGKPTEALGIKFMVHIPEEFRHWKVSKPVKRNLFLIAKEGINNCLKYARCKNIRINFHLKSKKLTMVVEDDGEGFDSSGQHTGYGLTNIRNRAIQIGFECIIDSSSAGTIIKVAAK